MKRSILANHYLCSQAWWGFISANDKHKLSSVIHKVKRCNLDGDLVLPELEEER